MIILIQKYWCEFSSRCFFCCSEIQWHLYQHTLKLSGNIKKVSNPDWLADTQLPDNRYALTEAIFPAQVKTNFIEKSPSWEANPRVHYCIHKNLQPVPIMSQINLVNAPHPTSWRSILISSNHLCLGLSSGLPIKILYAPLQFPMCATCPAHLILLDLMAQIFGEYRS